MSPPRIRRHLFFHEAMDDTLFFDFVLILRSTIVFLTVLRMFFSRPHGPTEHIFEWFLAVRMALPKIFLVVFVVRMALPSIFLKVFLPSAWPYRKTFLKENLDNSLRTYIILRS